MNVLALDTSTQYLSLALEANGKRSYFLEEVGNLQSVHILPKIKQLLQQSDLTIQDIDLIAYNQGPGSFTGLRIGLAVALGISYGLGIKLVPIPGFAISAYGYTGDVLVAIDARLNQVYLAGINTPSFEYFLSPQLMNPEQIPYLPDCKFIGNGFSIYSRQLNVAFKTMAINEITYYPLAYNLLDLVQLNKYAPVTPQNAEILYLRNNVALTLAQQNQTKNFIQ